MLFDCIDSSLLPTTETDTQMASTNRKLERSGSSISVTNDSIVSAACHTATTNNNCTSANMASSGRRRTSMFDPIDPTELQKKLYQNKHVVNIFKLRFN